VDHRANLLDHEVASLLMLGPAPHVSPELKDVFRHNALFIGPNVREAVNQGYADYTPIFLSEIPGMFRNGRIPVDVALIQVSPPDRHGFCSLGVDVNVTRSAVVAAKAVIAEVNEQMPRTWGHTFIHVDHLTAMVPSDRPLLELPTPEPAPEMDAVGKYVADLVPDGSTLQIGIGAIPEATLKYLRDKKDLGIHTELFSDGVMELMKERVITNARKTLHPGKAITTLVLGSQRLYEFLRDNAQVEFHPTDYVNDPVVIAQNERMMAINTALEVDLTGQVCADSLGESFYSGIGGQVDFIRGAARSRGGKPIIALPSTAMDGSLSRIVPKLSDGAGVVTTRGDVHYVVTEFGVASLHGRSIRERALALIEVAHPKFRSWLIAEAKRRNYIYRDIQETPVEISSYPDKFVKHVTLKDGSVVLIRPVRPADEQKLRRPFYNVSGGEETMVQRFFAVRRAKTGEQLRDLCNPDYEQDYTAIVCVGDEEDTQEIVGMGGYYVDKATHFAEVAFVVVGAYQGRGIGRRLLEHLVQIARIRGVQAFTNQALPGDPKLHKLFVDLGYPVETSVHEGVQQLIIRFQAPGDELGGEGPTFGAAPPSGR
jgi:acyl-CoA hydrolase/GNAT superfamily N-acetyltransferase